jgi:NADH:ubiquinone oxidoreductase subunit 6 (subunit J)
MLDFKTNSLLKNKMKYIPIGLIFNFFLIVPLFINVDLNFINNFNFSHFYQNIYQNWYCLIDSTTDTQIYSQILYSYYVLQFLISGLILMNVLISVVYLTNTFYKQQINHQSVFKQLSRNIKFFYKT